VVKRYVPTLPPVLGVRQELEQVLLNLLVNAWHAMAGGGLLTMVTERQDAQAVIAIADTGCGIPEAHMSRLFEPFFTTKPMEQGTGLGLAVDWVLPLEKDRPTLSQERSGGLLRTRTMRNGLLTSGTRLAAGLWRTLVYKHQILHGYYRNPVVVWKSLGGEYSGFSPPRGMGAGSPPERHPP
jgi:hypothetical protein